MKYRYREPHEMKDSGVEWLGMIPKEWGVSKYKNISKIYGRIGFRGYTVNDLVDKGEGALTLSPSNIIDQKLVFKKNSYISWEKYHESPEIKIKENDIVFVKTASVGKVAYIENLQEKVTLNPQLIVYKDICYNNKLFYYNLISNSFQNQTKQHLNGGVLATLTQDNLKNYYIPLLKPMEQGKIADFLDQKTSEFDSVIKKKERLIERLEEAKKSLISEVVTGKKRVYIDENGQLKVENRPTEEMKDSGVEWLGMIPKEWGRTKLKYEIKVKARLGWKGLKAEEYVGSGYIFLATPNIKGSEIDFQNVNYITKERYEESPEIMLKEGDILLTKDGSTLGTVNRVKVLPKSATVNSSIAVLRVQQNFNYNYVYYLIRTQGIQNIIEYFKDGMGVPHLFQSDIKNFDLPLPQNFTEQSDITDFLDLKIEGFDKLIEKNRTQIEELKKAKESLISEAVTGKIEIM